MQGLLAHRPCADRSADPRLAYALPTRVPGADDRSRRPPTRITRHGQTPADAPMAIPTSPERTRAERRLKVLQQFAAGRRRRIARGLR